MCSFSFTAACRPSTCALERTTFTLSCHVSGAPSSAKSSGASDLVTIATSGQAQQTSPCTIYQHSLDGATSSLQLFGQIICILAEKFNGMNP